MMWKPQSKFEVVEFFFAGAILIALAYDFWFLVQYKYFPQPFFYDIGDTWMDWFNPAYWAHQPGTYDSFKSIYPPLTFVILKFITYGPCYVGNEGGWPRECDMMGVTAIFVTYLIAAVLTVKMMWKLDRRTAIPRSVALCVGLPMIWSFDRGNVILFTYIFLILAYGPLIKSARLRWVFAGLAVNMKVYLIGTLLAQLLHRRWLWAEGAILATVLVYLITFAWFGVGSPIEIYNNIIEFSGVFVATNPLDIWIASSLGPLQQLGNSQVFPALLYVGSRNVDLLNFFIPIVMRTGQALVALAAVACMIRPEAVPRFRMLTLSIGVAVFTVEVSAYSEILVLLFCFMEAGRGLLRRYALIVSYIVCIPQDYDIDRLPPLVKTSFLFKQDAIIEYVVQVGPFVRPFLFVSIPAALALLTIIQVYQDIIRQGWSGRWRFRRDTPLFPWVRKPLPPPRTISG